MLQCSLYILGFSRVFLGCSRARPIFVTLGIPYDRPLSYYTTARAGFDIHRPQIVEGICSRAGSLKQNSFMGSSIAQTLNCLNGLEWTKRYRAKRDKKMRRYVNLSTRFCIKKEQKQSVVFTLAQIQGKHSARGVDQEFIVNVWVVRNTKLYGKDTCPGPQSGSSENQNGKFSNGRNGR